MLRAFGRVLASRSWQQRSLVPLLATDVSAGLDTAAPRLQPALAAFCAAPHLVQQAQVSPSGHEAICSCFVLYLYLPMPSRRLAR